MVTQQQVPSQRLQERISREDTYIFVNALGNIEFFNAFKYSWADAGEQFGVNTLYMGPPDLNIATMLESFNKAISMNPAGIAVWGVDPRLNAVIQSATDKGIPVVTVIGDLQDSARISYVGSSQYQLGYAAGMGYLDYVGKQGQVAILSLPGITMFDEREQGARQALKQAGGIDVVAVVDTKADSIIAVKAAQQILKKHPELDGFIGLDSTSAMGAAVAVQAAGKEGSVAIIGMERNADMLEKIKSGMIVASVAQGDYMMAFWALQTLINHNYYQPQLTIDNQAARAVTDPVKIYIPSNYVDINNVDLYRDANRLYKNY